MTVDGVSPISWRAGSGLFQQALRDNKKGGTDQEMESVKMVPIALLAEAKEMIVNQQKKAALTSRKRMAPKTVSTLEEGRDSDFEVNLDSPIRT
jgi:hypothetical protein